ncbi:hypothetical protein [Clostridium perfringens]|uniref:hypothetical protein n=1 Tax=Clostridium perfringens TaxID=1502 RepID=UPI0018E40FCE|nr:hypothetical protein [Clostridium perfringens]MBI6057805.1 hypothetical protein [Clostridium perfringens]MDK0542373.1 hypothetical protein [Clostridium perfringens]MDK0678344.1 hypothetical protein [Clostridium perfringens]MDK0704694.1 hypothetical protein [Clostridium perfringens]MDK0785834.1 hypothetical protein [Clostridium perfringens]
MFNKKQLMNEYLSKFPEIESKNWNYEKVKNQMSREVIKIFFSTNYKSTSARMRYLRATLNFIDYIALNTKVKHLSNIKYYHIKEYILHLLNKRKSNGEKLKENYINTEINGVLHYFNLVKINNPKLKKGAAYLIQEVKRENAI